METVLPIFLLRQLMIFYGFWTGKRDVWGNTCDACRNIWGKLKEGNVFLIEDFFVKLAKNMYKAVEGSSMKITPWSKV